MNSQANKAHKLVQEDINILKSALDIESCLTFTPNLIRHKNQISNKVISNRLKSHGFQVKWEYVKIFILAGCLYLKLNVSNDRANTVKQLFWSCWSATEMYSVPTFLPMVTKQFRPLNQGNRVNAMTDKSNLALHERERCFFGDQLVGVPNRQTIVDVYYTILWYNAWDIVLMQFG